jgi:SAP domain
MSSYYNSYATLKVGQLRQLCRQRGLVSDGTKEEILARLQTQDSQTHEDSTRPSSPIDFLTSEEMKEIATIADEIRHIRRQQVRFITSA